MPKLSHTTGRKVLLIKHALILNSIHDILNLRDICHMYNISSIKETRESQLSSKYKIVRKAIVRHNSETTVNLKGEFAVVPTDKICGRSL